MAAELWFLGVKPGWSSHTGVHGCKVSAELDSVRVFYEGPDATPLERAF